MICALSYRFWWGITHEGGRNFHHGVYCAKSQRGIFIIMESTLPNPQKGFSSWSLLCQIAKSDFCPEFSICIHITVASRTNQSSHRRNQTFDRTLYSVVLNLMSNGSTFKIDGCFFSFESIRLSWTCLLYLRFVLCQTRTVTYVWQMQMVMYAWLLHDRTFELLIDWLMDGWMDGLIDWLIDWLMDQWINR